MTRGPLLDGEKGTFLPQEKSKEQTAGGEGTEQALVLFTALPLPAPSLLQVLELMLARTARKKSAEENK